MHLHTKLNFFLVHQLDVNIVSIRFKDGNKVTPSAKHELVSFHDDIFSLLIKQVEEEDSGRYTCLARNEYGEAKSEALLNVLGQS